MAKTNNITAGGRRSSSVGSIKRLQSTVSHLNQTSGIDIESLFPLLNSKFLRKTVDEVSYKPITVHNTVTVDRLVTDGAIDKYVNGVGAILSTNPDGTAKLTIDDLAVRRVTTFNEVVIQQLSHTGGIDVVSAANIVCTGVSFIPYADATCPTGVLDLINASIEDTDAKHTGVYRCLFDNKNGNIPNLFVVGDVALSQTFNFSVSGSYDIKYYRRRVVGVGYNYIDIEQYGIALSGDEDSFIANGDNIVQWGHLWDKKRQSVVEINTTDGGLQTFYQEMGNCRSVLVGDEENEVESREDFADYSSLSTSDKQLLWGSNLWYSNVEKNTIDIGLVMQEDGSYENMARIYGSFFVGDRNGDGVKYDRKSKKLSIIADSVKFATSEGGYLDVKDALDAIADFGSDGKLTPIEKQSIELEWTKIESQNLSIVADLATYTAVDGTDYVTAYTVLDEYLWGVDDADGLLSDMTVSSDIDRLEYISNFEDFYFEQIDILNEISDARTLGSINSGLSGYEYLKAGINEDTTISGGLILSSLLQLGVTDSNGVRKIMAGLNGIDLDRNDTDIGLWLGGAMVDGGFGLLNPAVVENYAKTVLRLDGSGYLANGNIYWDKNGNVTGIFDDVKILAGEAQVEVYHKGNANLSTVDWLANNLTAVGNIYGGGDVIAVDVEGDTGSGLDANALHDYLIANKTTNGWTSGEYIHSSYINLSGYATTTQLNNKLDSSAISAWAKASTKPSYTASEVGALPSNDTRINNWSTAYGWGNHASAGYLTTYVASSTYLPLSGGTLSGRLYQYGNVSGDRYITRSMRSYYSTTIWHETVEGSTYRLATGSTDTTEVFRLDNFGVYYRGQAIYHSGNFTPSDYLTTSVASSTYLPLSGGKLTGEVKAKGYLKVYTTSDANYAYVKQTSETNNTSNVLIGGCYGYSVPKDALRLYNGSAYAVMNHGDSQTYHLLYHSGNFTPSDILAKIKTVDGVGSGLDADLLQGMSVAQSTSTYTFGKIMAISPGGVVEAGRYLDFHFADGTVDRSVRLQTPDVSNVDIMLPSYAGTLARTADNVASATRLQGTYNLWGQSFYGNNVSGDLSSVDTIYGSQSDNQILLNSAALGLSNSGVGVALHQSALRPYLASANLIDLGTSQYRWKGIYGNTLSLNGAITGATNITASGLTTTNTLKLTNTSGVAHLAFGRGNYNYITAPTSGSISIITNGKNISTSNIDLHITSTGIGVKKATPTEALDVNGNAKVSGNGTFGGNIYGGGDVIAVDVI